MLILPFEIPQLPNRRDLLRITSNGAHMRIILAGATGFIGTALVKAILARGHDIVILSRNTQKAKDHFSGVNITISQWDAKTSRGWLHLAAGSYGIINLAGESVAGLWTKNKKARILQSRLDAIDAIFEAVRLVKTKPKFVIQASAICCPLDTEEPCDESSPYGTNFLAEVTRQCETSAQRIRNAGARLVLVRTSFVLGKDGGALEPMIKPFKFFLGCYFGTGKQYLSWITLEDEINAILFLVEHEDLGGAFNLTAPKPLRIKTFCRILGKILKRPCLFSIPPFAARLIMGQMAEELLLSGQNAIPKRLLECGYSFKHTDLEKALSEILR